MATKRDLQDWIVAALEQSGGALHNVRVAEQIWRHHEQELRDSGDLFYTWQYDLRWAAQKLRDSGLLSPIQGRSGDGVWRLARSPKQTRE